MMRSGWHEIVDAEIEKVSSPDLARAAQEISEAYRSTRAEQAPLIRTAAHRTAYLAVRMPATYAAVSSALGRLRECAPMLSPTTLLDLGAGPGTAALATLDVFPSVNNIIMVECDPDFARISRQLLPRAEVRLGNLSSVTLPSADLIVCAYALNELTSAARSDLMRQAMDKAAHAVIFIEPGSRDGFAHILAARDALIGHSDFQIAAPCPGHMACSLAEVGDWCHFSARVQRSSLHRRLKAAELSYEDEKFSYVAAVRGGAERAPARIVRRPEKLTGHTKLSLCTQEGLRTRTVTKKHGADYKAARKAEWGDPFPII